MKRRHHCKTSHAKLTLAVLALCSMTAFWGGAAWAADAGQTPDSVQDGIHYFSVNPENGNRDKNYNNDGAVGKDSLAIDPNKSMLFPDVADNHWAYEYVTKLAGNGIIEGYPDGLFKGNQVMTRYEFAAIVYRLMEKGMGHTDPEMNRLAREFSNELSYIRIDTVHQDKDGTPTVQRVRVKK